MLTYMYITNKTYVAEIIDELGVDRVWIDLEVLGKEERQKNYDSVKSKHSIDDVKAIKPLLKQAKLQVRINPMNQDSQEEIDQVIAAGCDYIMLPMYKTVDEVQDFVKMVAGRAKTILLLETKEAADILDEVLRIDGVDEMHIGLNDLHLSMKKKFMFELLVDGTVETICQKIANSGKPYGIGGVARLGQGMLAAENIVAEHYRLGSTRAILSRSFCNCDLVAAEDLKIEFQKALTELKQYEQTLQKKDATFFEDNRVKTKQIVESIVATMEG